MEILRSSALQWIFQGAEWTTAREIAGLAGVSMKSVNAWKKKRKVFAVSHQGRDLYPKYAFNTAWRPAGGVADVLAILADSPSGSIAAWFESPSSFLSGRRPRELLQDDPDQVRAAARNTVLDEKYAG